MKIRLEKPVLQLHDLSRSKAEKANSWQMTTLFDNRPATLYQRQLLETMNAPQKNQMPVFQRLRLDRTINPDGFNVAGELHPESDGKWLWGRCNEERKDKEALFSEEIFHTKDSYWDEQTMEEIDPVTGQRRWGDPPHLRVYAGVGYMLLCLQDTLKLRPRFEKYEESADKKYTILKEMWDDDIDRTVDRYLTISLKPGK
ncbi:MAG: hypothetical protein AAGA66_09935 [Bacteroidota bacterium]